MVEIISSRLDKVFWVPSEFIPLLQEESLDGSTYATSSLFKRNREIEVGLLGVIAVINADL